MASFFTSGLAVDVVLAVVLIEVAVLIGMARRGERRRAAVTASLAVAPGVLLLLALRAALVGAEWPWIALPLIASFPAHIADLRRRR